MPASLKRLVLICRLYTPAQPCPVRSLCLMRLPPEPAYLSRFRSAIRRTTVPTSLLGTVDIESGTAFAYAVFFSVPTFTNPSGNPRTITNNLTAAGAAQCASFPCTATGRFEDNSPPAFAASYTISPAVVATPEPGYALLLPVLLVGFVIGKRILRTV